MIIDADLSEIYVAYIKPVVDNSLSPTSVNPVQNKVITEAIENINIKNDSLTERISRLEALLNKSGYNVMMVKQEEGNNG